MKFKLTYTIIAIFIFTISGCKESKIYEIIDENSMQNIKTSITVRLKKKIDEAQLKKIASEIRNNDRQRYERIFIEYYLPEMEINKGAWATSHFNPDLEIKMLGSTKGFEEKNNNTDDKIQGEIIGRWIDNTAPGGIYTLINNNNDYSMLIKYKDGSVMTEELSRKNVAGKIQFIKKGNSFGEFYMITPNNSLGIFDNDGLIRTITKM